MKSISVPYDFVIRISNENLFKEFALWLKLKVLYSNHTIIYNWSYRKLTEQTGMAFSTIKKYLPRLIELGWVELRDGHLLVKGFKKVCGSRTKNSGVITLSLSTRFNEVVDNVRALLIKRDYEVQKFRIRLRFGGLKASSRKQSKWYRKYESGREQQNFEKIKNRILTSSRRISGQINLSPSGALAYAKRITKNRVLKLTPTTEIVRECVPYISPYHSVHGYVTWRNGTVYLNRGLTISL